MIKIYECKICKGFVERGLKGEKRITGIRKDVRKHLVEVHNIKGQKNTQGLTKKDMGKSSITNNMLSEEFK